MTQKDILAKHHIVSGLYPVADAFAGVMTTDYLSLKDYRKVTFVIHTGVATGGTANGVVTVLAASSAAGAGAGAVPFRYRKCLSSASVDTWGALTAALAAGFAMTPGSNVLYIVEVAADEIEGVDPGNPFVALRVTEDSNDPVVAGVIAILSEPRYGVGTPRTAIA